MDTSILACELSQRETSPVSARATGVSVIIPVFNEEGAIVRTLQRLVNVLREFACTYEILVVNDGSTDRTSDLLRNVVGQTDIRVIEHAGNQGYGASLKTGIRYARFPWIAIVDADGSYPLEQIPHLLELAEDMDMVVGARTGTEVEPKGPRGVARYLLRCFAQWLTDRRIPDLNSGLRVFRRDVAKRFLRILPNGFSFTSTITLAMLTQSYRVHFEPIRYYRRIGRSKLRPFRDTLNFLRLIVRTVVYFAPLRVFLPAAGLFFAAFCGTLGWDVLVRGDLTERTVILLTAAAQLGFFAMLADMIDKRCC
jgi:glycosyltransferase involved in cell wall biosynthesis